LTVPPLLAAVHDFAVIATKLPARTTQEAVLTGRPHAALDAASAGIVH
jgi:hypothetical protein